MQKSRSQALFASAQKAIPGGVNSPVRAFKGVGETPLFFKRGEGAFLWDEDGNRYIDYVGSWGPLILGHADPLVIERVQTALKNGLSFGAPTEVELLVAEKILQYMPNLQLVRMVNSGTESTMTALRLARAYTKRDLIIKFEGCYHGHSDSLLVKAGSGGLTFGVPTSPGVPKAIAELTLNVPYNNIAVLKDTFQKLGEKIAGVIVEPIAGNMGCVPPIPGFLEAIREQCTQYGALFILDEVMTGFRVAQGGAQALYNITPDITTLGKIIGGGMPTAALGGSFEIMSYLAPLGPVYQAGTLSGNPVAMHAGLATLEQLATPGFYEHTTRYTEQLALGLQEIAEQTGIPALVSYAPGMFSLFFTEQKEVLHLDHVMACNTERFKQFFHGMLEEGIYLAPSPFEVGFVCSAHNNGTLDRTLTAARKVFTRL